MALAENVKSAALGAILGKKAVPHKPAEDVDDKAEARRSAMKALSAALKGEDWDSAADAFDAAYQELHAGRK